MIAAPRICVFCASADVDGRFHDLAVDLGQWLGRQAATLVFGGTDVGLMGTLARTVHKAGGSVVSVVPRAMHDKGIAYLAANELVVTDDLPERKSAMIQQADAFVVLPGGIGTLDELFEVAALRYLRILHAPVVLVNLDGFYDDLLRFWDSLHTRGFTRMKPGELIDIVADVNGCVDALQQVVRPASR